MRLTVGPTAAALLLAGAPSRSPPPVGLFGSRSLPPEVVDDEPELLARARAACGVDAADVKREVVVNRPTTALVNFVLI